jgi:hypothetical protein
MRKRSSLALIAAFLVLFGAGCGRQGSATNEIGLIYTGGLTEDKKFKGFLKAGATWEGVGWGSKVYRYRTDQRSYIGGERKGADAPPIVVVSKDGVRLKTDYQLYFKLNRDEKTLRKFHEDIGVKTEAWTKDGWVAMLQQYFEPQIERSMEAAALAYDMRPLRSTEEARVSFQNDTIGRLKEAIKEVIGDEYFCGPSYNGPGTKCGAFTFTVGKPEPVNEEIVAAIEAEQTAVAQTLAQEQTNARISKELEVERELVKLYGPDGALLREAIKSGKVSNFIVDSTGRISVPPSG